MKKTSTIRKVLVLMLVTAFFASCSSARKTTKAKEEVDDTISVITSETQNTDCSGNYEWVVKGTPNGDQAGSMSLKKNESGYTGELVAMGMSVPIDKLTVKGNEMIGYIAVQDMELGFAIVFEGDGFKGEIFTMEEGYPFTGKKIK